MVEQKLKIMYRRPVKFVKQIIFIGFFLLFCTVSVGMAEDYKLPDTGIDKCYDKKGEIPCPSKGETYYGQDAQYRGHKMAYQDNGDGTVTDLNTLLMWQQADNGSTREWQTACDYCEYLNLAGYSDWRIPTRRELISIVDVGKVYPAINTDYFPDCQTSTVYWSGDAIGTSMAWIVNFQAGRVLSVSMSHDVSVKCVRLGQ